jgi:hypothetical protein
MQEKMAAQKALSDAILAQRQQEMQTALGARQTAISAYGGTTPEGSWLDKYGNAVIGGASAVAKSFATRAALRRATKTSTSSSVRVADLGRMRRSARVKVI